MKIAPTKAAARSGRTGQARRKQRQRRRGCTSTHQHLLSAPGVADPCSHPNTGISLLLRVFRNAPRAGRWPARTAARRQAVALVATSATLIGGSTPPAFPLARVFAADRGRGSDVEPRAASPGGRHDCSLTDGALRRRGQRTALAHAKGVRPAISLAGVSAYCVVDRRRRISVARALGPRDIDAWVTGCSACVGATARRCRRAGS